MAINTCKSNCPTPLHFKGLTLPSNCRSPIAVIPMLSLCQSPRRLISTAIALAAADTAADGNKGW